MSLFCFHKYEVTKAVFPTSREITAVESSGLVAYKSVSINSSYSKTRVTIYKTHYSLGNNEVTLFVKRCKHCGKVTACNAFEAQNYTAISIEQINKRVNI